MSTLSCEYNILKMRTILADIKLNLKAKHQCQIERKFKNKITAADYVDLMDLMKHEEQSKLQGIRKIKRINRLNIFEISAYIN